AAALPARRAREEEAGVPGASHTVPAAVMLRLGADPAAWFGIEAEPGFAFTDEAKIARLSPAASRGIGGYLPDRPEMDAGFVAYGAGLRRGVRVPRMGLVAGAPTLGRPTGPAPPPPPRPAPLRGV